MVIWKLIVSVILESSVLTNRFQKKNVEKITLLFCNWYVIVSIGVVIKNKSRTFSCSWVKTLNNKILINWGGPKICISIFVDIKNAWDVLLWHGAFCPHILNVSNNVSESPYIHHTSILMLYNVARLHILIQNVY